MPCLNTFTPSQFASKPLGVVGKMTQRGYVMVLSMLMLLIITVISISMAKSFFLEEGMSGNLREKTRAIGAAQAALTYGEWYVANHQGYGSNCATGYSSNPIICNLPAAYNGQGGTVSSTSTTTLNSAIPLQTYFNSPPNPTYLGINTAGGQDKYYAQPGLYIQFIGLDTTNSDYIYKITAYGYGGTSSTVAIVQSTFMTLAAVKNLGGA